MTFPQRLSRRAVEEVAARCGPRDQAILTDLARLHVLTGAQLERLHFSDLTPSSRGVVRRRVLGRLVGWQLVTTLQRTIGGQRAGSSGLVYALDTAGQRVLPLLEPGREFATGGRARRPWTPSTPFLRHGLDIAELYVQLVEQGRQQRCSLIDFEAEPACWWQTARGQQLKPDAHLILRSDTVEDHYWIEVDRATESLPALRRQLDAYLTFFRSGDPGPDDVAPQVLITVPQEKRVRAVQQIVRSLPGQATEVFEVVLLDEACSALVERLLTSDENPYGS